MSRTRPRRAFKPRPGKKRVVRKGKMGGQHRANMFAPLGAVKKFLWHKVYTFIKSIPDSILSSDPLTETTLLAHYSISQSTDLSTLSAFFDFYRFARVTLTFKPLVTEAIANVDGAVGPNQFYLPNIWISDDHSGSSVAPSVSNLRGRADAKCFQTTEPFIYEIRPSPLTEVYDGLTPAYSDMGQKWLSCIYTDVPHYGVRAAIEPSVPPSTSTFGWRIEVTFVVEFKNPI